MIQKVLTIYTIGHSTHSVEKFIQLLKQQSVDVVVDVRSSPYSKYNTQYNRDELKKNLNGRNLKYLFLGDELGGRPANSHCYVNSKISFEKIRQTNSFQIGLQRVLKGAGKYNLALLCSEKDPLMCHRGILIAKELADHGVTVNHILEDGSIIDQAELEKQLLKRLHLEETFFSNHNELVSDAYKMQEQCICYSLEHQEPEYQER